MKEAAELRDPTEHYHAQPLEVSLEQQCCSISTTFLLSLAIDQQINNTTHNRLFGF